MSERHEISEADAVRMLYLKQTTETIRLRRLVLDRDLRQIDRDSAATEQALLELFERVGMMDGATLEEDGGRYYIVSPRQIPPTPPASPTPPAPPIKPYPPIPDLSIKKLRRPGHASPMMDAPKPESKGAASGE